MGVAELLGGVALLITASGGVYIAIHETRRKERRVTRKEIDELVTEVESLQHLLLEQRRYIYKLVTLMIEAGMDPPRPPAPSFDPGEYDDKPKGDKDAQTQGDQSR